MSEPSVYVDGRGGVVVAIPRATAHGTSTLHVPLVSRDEVDAMDSGMLERVAQHRLGVVLDVVASLTDALPVARGIEEDRIREGRERKVTLLCMFAEDRNITAAQLARFSEAQRWEMCRRVAGVGSHKPPSAETWDQLVATKRAREGRATTQEARA